MYQVMSDEAGNIMFLPADDDDIRNARRAVRRRSRPRRRPRPSAPAHPQPAPYYAGPYQMTPPPMQYPAPTQYPVPMPQGSPIAGIDMRTGLKALGALLPSLGQLLSAFRRAPDKPEMSEDTKRSFSDIVDYIDEVFRHDRTGEQMVGVLATTGAVMEILGEL